MTKCTVCSRPDRDTVDRALLSGGSLRGLAQRYGTSRSSLDRHRAHAEVPAKPNGGPTMPAKAPTSIPPVTDRPAPTGRTQCKRRAPTPASLPEAPAVAVAHAAGPVATRPTELAALVDALQAVARANLESLTADAGLLPGDRSKLTTAAVAAVAVLARLQGATDAVGEAKIVRHPAVRRVLDVVVAACGPWPAAQAAVLEALRAFGEAPR